MTTWTVLLDETTPQVIIGDVVYQEGFINPREEAPNWVGYYTFTCSEDGRKAPLRVPFDPRDSHQPETFLAQKKKELEDADQRLIDMSLAMQSRTFASEVSLPNLSKQQVLQNVTRDLIIAVGTALVQKGTSLTKEQIQAATVFDPTISAKVAAVEAAVADIK